MKSCLPSLISSTKPPSANHPNSLIPSLAPSLRDSIDPPSSFDRLHSNFALLLNLSPFPPSSMVLGEVQLSSIIYSYPFTFTFILSTSVVTNSFVPNFTLKIPIIYIMLLFFSSTLPSHTFRLRVDTLTPLSQCTTLNYWVLSPLTHFSPHSFLALLLAVSHFNFPSCVVALYAIHMLSSIQHPNPTPLVVVLQWKMIKSQNFMRDWDGFTNTTSVKVKKWFVNEQRSRVQRSLNSNSWALVPSMRKCTMYPGVLQ